MSTESRRMLAIVALSLMSIGAVSACTAPEAATTDTEAEEEASVAAPVEEESASAPACLIGDWYIEQDQMQAFYSAVSESNDNVDISVEGGTGLSFSDTGYVYTPEFAILVQVAGADGTGSITGNVTGDYTATETEISTSHDVSAVAVSVTVSGITMDGTDLFGEFLSSAPINSAPYECADDGPIIQFDTGDGNPRVPITLTPAS
ncbi:hypothetical protein [Rhodoglobus sp.]